MLAQARRRGGYDALERAELVEWLNAHPDSADLVVSADTLCYFGVLDLALAAAQRALRPLGWLVFTVESLDESSTDAFRLLHHGRYAHRRDAVERWLRETGWHEIDSRAVVLRRELGQPVHGWLVSARAGERS